MKTRLKNLAVNNSALFVLALLLLFGVFFVDYFTKAQNFLNILVEISLYGMLAIGLSLVIMAGAIDLSIAYQVVVAATVAILLANAGGMWPAILGAVAAGLAMGLINGFIVTKMKIAPLIATIGAMMAYSGLAMFITNNGSLSADDKAFRLIFKTSLFGIKLLQLPVVVFAASIILLAVFLKKTRLGRNILFTGGNPEAAALAGINTGRVTFFCYAVCGLCSGVAGVFIASRVNAATITQAENLNVAAISSCVIGGISIFGGKGSAWKVLLGVAVIRVINKIMDLQTLAGSWVSVITGVLLIAILIADRYTGPNREES